MLPRAPHPGLCATCIHAQRILSDRGSEFWMCRRSLVEPEFPKYPGLPVMICGGFERAGGQVEGQRVEDGALKLEED